MPSATAHPEKARGQRPIAKLRPCCGERNSAASGSERQLNVRNHFNFQVCGDLVGISAVVAAMLGLSVLLLTGVLSWRDCLTYPPAWDTLFWFAVLVGAFV